MKVSPTIQEKLKENAKGLGFIPLSSLQELTEKEQEAAEADKGIDPECAEGAQRLVEQRECIGEARRADPQGKGAGSHSNGTYAVGE